MIPSFPKYVFIDDSSLERINIPNVLRSEMETGPQKTRPIQSVPMFNIRMNISICEDDLLNFKTWFKDLKFGSNWFLMNDPFDGTERRFRITNYDLSWKKLGDLLTSAIVVEAYDEL